MQFVAQLFSRSANKTGCRVRELRWKKIYQRDSAHGFLVRRGGIGIYIEETRRLFRVKPLFPERMLINVTQCLHSFHSSGSFFPLQLRHDYSTRYYCLINQECSHQIGNTGPTRPHIRDCFLKGDQFASLIAPFYLSESHHLVTDTSSRHLCIV